MHEISIAISLIDQVAEESANRGGIKVKSVHLSLGLLAGVDEQALQFCFASVCEGTPFEGVTLTIKVIPVAIYCPACKRETTPQSFRHFLCSGCMLPAKVIRGDELEIAALEIAA